MSGEEMSDEVLDAALHELGMLSARVHYHDEWACNRTRKRLDMSGMRLRANSVSTVNGRVPGVILKRAILRMEPYRSGFRPRTKSENESELPPKVPYVAFPIDSMLSSNLFKSRSMESIDAPSCEDSSVSNDKEQVPHNFPNLTEVDTVSSGMDRLNVCE